MTPLSRFPLAAALLAFGLAGCMNMGGPMSDDDPMMPGMMDEAAVTAYVSDWPEPSRNAVMATMDAYGAPSGVTPSMIVWEDSGPYKRTIAYREVVQHDFPMPHPDVLETFINYEIPEGMADELAMYDGSVILERTKGEMSARCDMEPLNILALNLAHEIITGERTVEEARMFYGEQAMAFKNGDPAPYTQRLLFSPPSDAAADDPDERLMMGGM